MKFAEDINHKYYYFILLFRLKKKKEVKFVKKIHDYSYVFL